MKTVSINVMNLCVPCENRCRYCLLSYNGKTTGVDFTRSTIYAKRFYNWIQENRPDLSFMFGFGYSMEHPDLISAIKFCQSIGSATGEFLQFDGMKFRTESELRELLSNLKSNGIKLINLTFYGTEHYHDRFAARTGDFNLMMNTLKVANEIDLDVSVGIPLFRDNADQIDELLGQLDHYRTVRIFCFIPHSEGRGRLLDSIRFTLDDYEKLSHRAKGYFNRDHFRAEQEWIKAPSLPQSKRRVVTVTLTPDNIDYFEQLDFAETIAHLEEMDNAYYRQIPDFQTLMKAYGDPNGTKMYSARDLYLHYQNQYIAENNIHIYDMNDERHCFSRRF